MFSPNAIITHLQTNLPKITNLFSDIVTVSGIILAGTTQTLRVAYPLHGLVTGKKITISDNLISNSITSVSLVTVNDIKYLRFTTSYNHDITLDYNASVTLTGFTNTALNTTWTVYNTINRKSFDIQYNTLPTLNATEKMNQFIENGLNGIWAVTKVNDNTFDILLTGKPQFQPQTVPLLKIATNFKLWHAEDWNNAKEVYTKQTTPQCGMFLIMEDASVSKSIDVESDANQMNAIGNEQRLKVINRFTLDIIQPASNEISAGNAIQKAWTDLLFIIVKIMAGVSFDSNTKYVTSLLEHVALEYNHAFYGHGYTFEYVYEITNSDVYYTNFVKSTSFKDIYLQFDEVQDGSYLSLDGGI